jgi:hypothetical protein
VANKPPPEVQSALEEFYAEIFLNIMIGMTKSDSVEADFAKLKEATQQMTKDEMQRIATRAGKFYAERANSHGKLSKKKAADLKVRALQFGLQPDDGANAKK